MSRTIYHWRISEDRSFDPIGAEQCNGGKKKYGGITGLDEMRANLRTSCLPESLLEGEAPSYDDYLAGGVRSEK